MGWRRERVVIIFCCADRCFITVVTFLTRKRHIWLLFYCCVLWLLQQLSHSLAESSHVVVILLLCYVTTCTFDVVKYVHMVQHYSTNTHTYM